MIYAIHAVGTEYVKIGVTAARKKLGRLSGLQTGCPFELVIVAQADWPHSVEREIHRHLKRHGLHVRGEWFKINDTTEEVLRMLRSGRIGLSAWQVHARPVNHDVHGSINSRLAKVLAYCRSK